MSHGATVNINLAEVIEAEPLRVSSTLARWMWLFIIIGTVAFLLGLILDTPQHFWGCFFVNLCFFMGMSCGAVVLSAIFQVVRAKWAAPLTRICEANVAFLPWAFILWLSTYFGKEILYPWAREPMPGREWWMQPDFVYGRFIVLFGLLFYFMHKLVKYSLRGDVGFLREHALNKERWAGHHYDVLTAGWKGSAAEIAEIQPKRSWYSPLVIALYGVIYSLFVFEMVMAMDPIWYANMFGGFNFIGNIYMGWAVLNITSLLLAWNHERFAKVLHVDQFWDMGKMTLAFCILWGYMFWAHFLPQWYGNLPEETQWMILRTREFPWKGLGWVTFALCFITPFILLLSRDIKKSPKYFIRIGFIILTGMWLEKYMVIMPQLSPSRIPFNGLEIGLFLGFLGIYVLAVRSFLAKYPFISVAHPLSRGSQRW